MAVTSSVFPQPGALGGPISKDFCCADRTNLGLLAYSCGSSIAIVDERSLQLVHTLTPSDQTEPPITALQFLPTHLSRVTPHLRLASGDKSGRIAVWDVAAELVAVWLVHEKPGQIVEEIMWVYGRPWLLAALYGAGVFVLWDPNLKRALWTHVIGPEPIVSILWDAVESSKIILTGERGLLMTITVNSGREWTITHQTEKMAEKSNDCPGLDSNSAVLQASHLRIVPGVLLVLQPRQILAYDTQFQRFVACTPSPRGIARLVYFISPPHSSLLFTLHADSTLSLWRLKSMSELKYTPVHNESLVPSLASPSPSPQVLALLHSPLLLLNSLQPWQPSLLPTPAKEVSLFQEIDVPHLITSITDDGKLWQWRFNLQRSENGSHHSAKEISGDMEVQGPSGSHGQSLGQDAEVTASSLVVKVELCGMMQGLPADVTTLAVPCPSILAIKQDAVNGSAKAAPAVPLVALATQCGSIELWDCASHAICTSFTLHSSMVRGVRWLGNHRLVSYSHTEVKSKQGNGYVNTIVLTDVRSGQSRTFRTQPTTPEKAPVRGLRASPSGRYLLILFRDGPTEVWSMTKTPSLLRSLLLPFSVMEWASPPLPMGLSQIPHSSPTPSKHTIPAPQSPSTPGSERSLNLEDVGESFAFALVNGSLGVFELSGRRVRDFRPKWPAASFVEMDLLVTTIAYRTPHVVLGDRSGCVRWWDVASGHAAVFQVRRGPIRRIRFAPVLATSTASRGRVSILFSDHTFTLFDLDTGEVVPRGVLPDSVTQLHMLEMDWLPLQGPSVVWPHAFPQLLCAAVPDGSVRLITIHASLPIREVAPNAPRVAIWRRFRSSPLTCVGLLPLHHALSIRLLLQFGVDSSWLEPPSESDASQSDSPGPTELLRFLLDEPDLPQVVRVAFLEIMLKSLEGQRIEGRILEMESAREYIQIRENGIPARCAFVAHYFGDHDESHFWQTLPSLLRIYNQTLKQPIFRNTSVGESTPTMSFNRRAMEDSLGSPFASVKSPGLGYTEALQNGGRTRDRLDEVLVGTIWGDLNATRTAALERVTWHKQLAGDDVVQKQIHEFVTVGDYESAVSLLLASPPDSPAFFVNALRAVTLAAAVSPAMHEFAVKVLAANMIQSQEPLAAVHLLCAVGCYQEACFQLQDAGKWTDAWTLACTHLNHLDRARILLKWGEHCLQIENDVWKALSLFVSAGAFSRVVAALLGSRQPDAAVFFLLACYEAGTMTPSDPPPLSFPEDTAASDPVADQQSTDSKATVDDLDSPTIEVTRASSEWVRLFKVDNLGSDKAVMNVLRSQFENYEQWLAHACLSPPAY